MKRCALLLGVLITMSCSMDHNPARIFSDPDLARVLKDSCKPNQAEAVRVAASKVNLNTLGTDGSSPLYWLLRNCRAAPERVSELVSEGANPHLYLPQYNVSPAIFAVREMEAVYLKAMLRAGLEPNHKYSEFLDSPTLLFFAVMFRDKQKVEMLLDAGANIEERNASGDTPLLFVRANQFEVALTLLKHGADAHARNNQGHDICYRIFGNRYVAPSAGPDYRSLLLLELRNRGVDCSAHSEPVPPAK
jgi:uncharacterized protein